MSSARSSLRRAASRARNRIRDLGRRRAYRAALRSQGPAGEVTWVFDPTPPPPPPVELRLPARVPRDQAARWCAGQTLAELRAVGLEPDGSVAWTVEPKYVFNTGASASWFAAPGSLGDLSAVHLESCLLVAAAEVVNAVVLREGVSVGASAAIRSPRQAADPGVRQYALYSSSAWSYDPADDSVSPVRDDLLIKSIGGGGVGHIPHDREMYNRHRRGPYLSAAELGPTLAVGVRDAALLDRSPLGSDRPTVLVTVPFLARGGAEHTLFETMAALTNEFRFAIATLAPHRPELGDRRDDFRGLTHRIYSLGDLVHPAAMYGMLVSLIDSLGVEVLYNANSTTLFYEFAPRLKADRPGLRIVDHLYDHRVGYIKRYREDLRTTVDVCIAENHRIAEVLVSDHHWPESRVPVIWPCGRASSAYPPAEEWQEVRREVRDEIGLGHDDLVFLSAARMHPQKRPLDLVRLAERVRDIDHIQFLLVGGGDLEQEVDDAIAGTAAPVRRLPFRIDIPELIVASDAGCLVSDFEGLPVFMLECIQAGRPFLGTDVGDMGEVLRTTGAGVVVDRPGDLDALERGVRRLADPQERARLAKRAADAASRFDPSGCAAAYGAAWLGRQP